MSAIVIYGPGASGKTRNAQAFLAHYGKKNIVDEWDGTTRLADDDLALLTSDEPVCGRRYEYIHIGVALASVHGKPHLGTLDDWWMADANHGLDYIIRGKFVGHPQFDGLYGHTSYVVKREGNEIETRNSRYTLGTPRNQA